MPELPDLVLDAPEEFPESYIPRVRHAKIVSLTRDPFAPHRALIVTADGRWPIPRRRKLHVSVYLDIPLVETSTIGADPRRPIMAGVFWPTNEFTVDGRE
ncbi:MAG: hypothetical protein FJZ01_24575 [Candidatus Sericytochromatia bacterium]|nr:hypothetical protein [Candidatus Tanganyikabacteria bacterium]